MPQGDGTGPDGQGSRTGRGLGPCGTPPQDMENPFPKEGFFQRLGRGLGFGRNAQGRGIGRRGGRGRGRNR